MHPTEQYLKIGRQRGTSDKTCQQAGDSAANLDGREELLLGLLKVERLLDRLGMFSGKFVDTNLLERHNGDLAHREEAVQENQQKDNKETYHGYFCSDMRSRRFWPIYLK